MMDVQKVLRTGGVVELFRLCGIGGLGLDFAKEHGSNLKAAWATVPYPEALVQLALVTGAPRDMVAHAVYLSVERFVAEIGAKPHELVTKALRVTREALESGGKLEMLNASTEACARWLQTAKDRGEVCNPWDQALVTCCAALTQAMASIAGIAACSSAPLDMYFRSSLQTCLQYTVHARMEHGRKVGRIPPGAPIGAVVYWAAMQTANVVREQIPVEMVLAPRLAIPTVTLEGGVQAPKRERGQA